MKKEATVFSFVVLLNEFICEHKTEVKRENSAKLKLEHICDNQHIPWNAVKIGWEQ